MQSKTYNISLRHRPKILHVNLKSSYDGAFVYTVRLCKNLDEYEHNIVCCFKGNAYVEVLKTNINCNNLLNISKISYRYLLLKYWKFLGYLRGKSYDIIHYHQGGIGILLIAYLFRNNAKLVHHFHHANLIGDNIRNDIPIIHFYILKYLSKKTNQITVGRQVLDSYTHSIKQTKNVHLIRNSTPFRYRTKKNKNFRLLALVE